MTTTQTHVTRVETSSGEFRPMCSCGQAFPSYATTHAARGMAEAHAATAYPRDHPTDDRTPTLDTPRMLSGLAGTWSVTVTVTYPGEDPRPVRFIYSVYGGPVVMITGEGATRCEMFVDAQVIDRCGHPSISAESFVRRFFAPHES